MNNLNPQTAKIISIVVPVALAVLLAGGLSWALGLWNAPKPEEDKQANQAVADVVNKIKGVNAPSLAGPKAGLAYGYKGAPVSYAAKTDTVTVKVDFANPNTNETLTRNFEVRAYKFTKIVTPNADLSKGGVFDEATLRQAYNKQLGTFELDVYPIFSKEFKGVTLAPNVTRTLEASFTPNDNGYYIVIFAESSYFASNTGDKATAFIKVGGGALGQTAVKAVTPQTTSSTLPKTGGEAEMATLIAGILGIAGIHLKKRNK